MDQNANWSYCATLWCTTLWHRQWYNNYVLEIHFSSGLQNYLVGIASDNILWWQDDAKSTWDHEKHASQYVTSIFTYHSRSDFCIILSYIYSPSFGPSSSISYLSRNWAVSYSFMISTLHVAYIPMYSSFVSYYSPSIHHFDSSPAILPLPKYNIPFTKQPLVHSPPNWFCSVSIGKSTHSSIINDIIHPKLMTNTWTPTVLLCITRYSINYLEQY